MEIPLLSMFNPWQLCINKVISTTNPAVLPDWNNDVDEVSLPPHLLCHIQRWMTLTRTWLTSSLPDRDILVVQQPTAYTLATANKSVDLAIPTLYSPKQLLSDDPVLLTARNDGLINSYNPVQLSAWRANVDM